MPNKNNFVGFNRGSLNNVLQNKLSKMNFGHGNPYENRKFCKFCEIVETDPYNQILFQDENCVIFHDKYKRKTIDEHFLVVPKKHVKNIFEADKNVVFHLKACGLDYLTGNQEFQESLEQNDVFMGFHKPPYNSVHHLHLHIAFPRSKMNPLALRKIQNPGWLDIDDFLLKHS